jgi:lysophosphatidate acyltransferase
MSLSGAVFLDRGNNAKAVQSLQAAGDHMKKNRISLWLFPEGTRTLRENHDMRPFKKGAFHAAVQAGVPVIPVVCENYWRLYHKGVFESGELKIRGKNGFSYFMGDLYQLITVTRVLPPIPTAGLENSDVAQLAIQTREKMVAVLHEISTPASNDTPPPPPSKRVASPLSSQTSEISVKATSELGSERQIPTPEGSIASSRKEGSENGMETEEDEGMVLVGRQ